jgi:hypothetical protein
MPLSKASIDRMLVELKKVRAEMERRLRRSRGHKSKIRADLDHIGAVILIIENRFGYSRAFESYQNSANFDFEKPDCYRAAVSILENAKAPLTGAEMRRKYFIDGVFWSQLNDRFGTW